ncbi:MAG: chorismate synthase, partial [Atopobium sp.]|nr:chorismate synthase [Atopobium sp.]
SSIGLPQHSVNLQTMEPEQLVVQGRHDVTAVLRAVPCVESAFALALLDTLYSWPSEQNGYHND